MTDAEARTLIGVLKTGTSTERLASLIHLGNHYTPSRQLETEIAHAIVDSVYDSCQQVSSRVLQELLKLEARGFDALGLVRRRPPSLETRTLVEHLEARRIGRGK